MPHFRMTTRRWIAVVALLALGFASELRRADDRHGAGYNVARVLVAARQSGRPSRPVGTDDLYLLLGVAAAALIGSRLRRRFVGC